jgi:chitin disaccharide deacetylase
VKRQIPYVESSASQKIKSETGALIINADDWGRDRETTDRILECVTRRVISSASGMVFMEDAERAASFAREREIDIGLHLNLTETFSAPNVSAKLQEHHGQVALFLRRHRLFQTIYNPGLARSFEYVVKAQLDEFNRIYGEAPKRIDGHHHMHLSENVLAGRLLPSGTLVRRNFFFHPEEKSWINRRYRGFVDRRLQRRHQVVNFLFSIQPVETKRLERIFSYAREAVVELETHPVNRDEFEILTSREMTQLLRGVSIAPNFSRFTLRQMDVGSSML